MIEIDLKGYKRPCLVMQINGKILVQLGKFSIIELLVSL